MKKRTAIGALARSQGILCFRCNMIGFTWKQELKNGRKTKKENDGGFKVESVNATVKELNEKGIEIEPVRLDDYTRKKMTFSVIQMDCH